MFIRKYVNVFTIPVFLAKLSISLTTIMDIVE